MNPLLMAWRAALVVCLVSMSFPVLAQQGEIEEIVVTGTFIKGTPIDSESPVTILDRGELEAQGQPSVVEMVRRLSASSGIDGESNQFQSNASEGVASVNLRGLGPARTLVLINGRRQVAVPTRLPGGRFVDINNMPAIAINRVEVLKEGAAATYGSDAIGGVVNFLTRDSFSGFEILASHQEIEDSDGTQNLGAILGIDIGDSWNLVTSLGYERRNALSMRDRDFTTIPYEENPEGGWSSIGNPGVAFNPELVDAAIAAGSPFFVLAPTFGGVKDPNCDALGGTDQSLFCRFRYTDYDNLIEDEERLQWFTELNGEFGNGIGFHGEFLWAENDVPNWATSPSYPPQALFGDIQYTPPDHPGLVDMAAQYPELYGSFVDDSDGAATGATFYGRIRGVGSEGPRETYRKYDTYRLAFALDGEFNNGVGWDVGLTYSGSESDLGGVDAQIARTKLAFQGFGGFDCPATTDTAGNIVTNGAVAGEGGCLYYNPYSNAIQTSFAEATFGASNPAYNPAVANSAEVLEYLDDESNTNSKADLFVFDAVFQGDLFGGEAAWAAGYQYRRNSVKTELDDLINLDINPCPFPGQTDCSSQTGLRSFLSGSREVDENQDVHSLFVETAMSMTEDLDLQLAVRYEDYGSQSTFDPKLAVRWSATNWMTLRGSVQTTFRGPDIDATNPATVTALSYVAPTAAFKAIDVTGDPGVAPEEAFTYNIGAIFDPTDRLTFTIDYWSYDFKNPIIVEDFNALVDAYAAGGEQREAVQSQIFCTGGTNDGSCAASAIERIQVNTINGPRLKTSGVDFYANWDIDAGPGVFGLGLDFSHVIEYKVDEYIKNGVQVADAFDGAGFLNAGRGVRSLPDWKGRVFAQYTMSNHNFLLYLNHIGSYDDERTAPTEDAIIEAATGSTGRKIDSQSTFDFHYRLSLMQDDLRVIFSAINFTDEEPPRARLDLGYDAFTHNAFGRMFKIGVQYRFGGN